VLKIMLISHYAGSPSMGMAYRPYYLSRELNARGNHCAIVAGTYSHLRQENPYQQSTRRASHTTVEGIDWYWIPTRRYQGNGAQRVVSMLEFASKSWFLARRLAEEQQPDVVIASSTYPLDIYAAARIARTAGAALVFEVHDMWPLTPMLLGRLSERHPFIRIMQQAEDYYCRHADLVISVLPNAIEHLVTRGLTPDRYVVIPNGVDARAGRELQTPPEGHLSVLESAHAAGRSVVIYAGSEGLSNQLEALLRAATLVRDVPLQFVLVGQGPERVSLEQLAADLGLANVSFLPPVPRDQLEGLLALADVAYIGIGTSPLYHYGISPNKLYDYMMAGSCILLAGHDDVFNDVVAEGGCGLSVPHAVPDDIAGGIRRLLAMSAQERTRLGRKGSEYVRQHFDYAVLAQQYEIALSWAREHPRFPR